LTTHTFSAAEFDAYAACEFGIIAAASPNSARPPDAPRLFANYAPLRQCAGEVFDRVSPLASALSACATPRPFGFRDNAPARRQSLVASTQLAAKLAYNPDRDTTGAIRDTGGADCGAWDYHPDEPD
jgi:hypothetical protein